MEITDVLLLVAILAMTGGAVISLWIKARSKRRKQIQFILDDMDD